NNGCMTKQIKFHPVGVSLPNVHTLNKQARLLIENGAAHIGDVFGAEVFDQLESPAGVGDIVDDQDPGPGDVDGVEKWGQHDRKVQPLVNAGVELDAHHEDVLDVERIGHRRGGKQATASDAENDPRPVTAVGDHPGELLAGIP